MEVETIGVPNLTELAPSPRVATVEGISAPIVTIPANGSPPHVST
jgi:hypothetical protein